MRGYGYYRDALAAEVLPLAFVDLEAFDANAAALCARAGGKPIRVATKSVRCVSLLQRVLNSSPQFQGLMGYSCREAVLLAGRGFDDILVAYPVLGEAEVVLPGAPFESLAEALRGGKLIRLMVDGAEQVDRLESLGARERVTVPVCLDLDLSLRLPGLHFGVMRSPLRSAEQAVALWRRIARCAHVRLDGVMGYEAQIAGVQDRLAGQRVKSALVRVLKGRSLREVRRRRGAVVNALREAGAELRLVNGGGTGSLESTAEEDAVTEVTAGSGLFSSVLFDGYDRFRHVPAAGFALEVTRRPQAGIYTCHGGGYIASGAAGADRLPQPWLPEGMSLLGLEGAGEVQTPVRYAEEAPLEVGAPVFFRHAKAGELCERFEKLKLIAEGTVVEEVLTYRGEGWCFL